MSIRCPKCFKEYDVTLFQFDNKIFCDCGWELKLEHLRVIQEIDDIEAKVKAEEIKCLADEISSLIVASDIAKIDIEIEKKKLRDLCKKYFPDKLHLYDIIYESRFKRLWQQFRGNK